MKFIAKTFYSIDVYQSVLKWGFIKTSLYFIFICFLFSLSLLKIISQPVKESYNANIANVKTALQKVAIENGQIKYPQTNIEIKNSAGKTIGIVSKDFLDANTAKNLVFSIENNRFSIYPNGEEMSFNLQGINFAPAKNLAEILPTWNDVKFVILPVATLASALSVIVWRMLMLATFAFIMDIPHRRLRFVKSLKLAIVAQTPASLLGILFAITLNRILPDSASLAISAIILYFACINIIRSNTQQTN